jgi:hypothetical protein
MMARDAGRQHIAAGRRQSWPPVGGSHVIVPLHWPSDPARVCGSATGRDHANWITWRPRSMPRYAPPGHAPLSTTHGSHYAILTLAPATAHIVSATPSPVPSRIANATANRLVALRSAIRRLALRAAIVRATGIN